MFVLPIMSVAVAVLLLLVVFFCCSSAAISTPTSSPQADANALCTFKQAITDWPGSGAAISGWNCTINGSEAVATTLPCGSHPYNWTGVTCSGQHISQLDLSNQGITGQLSDSIANISTLEVINLGGNNLIGEISTIIFAISGLSTLILSDNMFNGKQPPSYYCIFIVCLSQNLYLTLHLLTSYFVFITLNRHTVINFGR
jgi:hypothetical protein